MTRRTVIIAPPPTPNGDLHTGHLAGPYLAGDVYARYLRASDRPVIFTSGTDDSQTYVVSSAARAGLTPEELALRSATQIRATLEAAGISVDGFAPFDKGYRQTVIDFVTDLHSDGAFRLKTVLLPYVEATGEYLMEGLVAGDCPVCLVESRGGLCESCGHPNNFDELLRPRSTVDPAAVVTHREAQILVLPMEEYRDRLADYYVRHRDVLRPHTAQLIREALERPLPDFPITYPTAWGIPAPFTETPGQVLNAWAEGMAASMYCTWYAAEQLGEHTDRFDEHWLSEHGIDLVYFLGFDNVYFWGMTHLALLMAHGDRYVEPHAIVSNEFYELENQKFSTSKGHVVWAADLVAEVPRDLVRFYLALTAPEHSRTNFSREALDSLSSSRLVEPWNRLAGRLDEMLAGVPADALLPVSATGAEQAGIVVERFRSHYELESFSLHRAADLIVVHLDRLLKQADRVAVDVPSDLGDLILAVRTLTACAAPLLVDVAARAERAGADLSLPAGAFAADPVAPLRLPLLSTAVGAFAPVAEPAVIRA
ncbi:MULTISPECIES: class I tRNA ligase family protein [Streptomyces]|uniref:Methionine--tRNA ligase n=1 Tax=Streptomyces virginiae TaxID=1961 RepID=A0A0L8N5Y5_STRVG|nr:MULTISPECIES: class I tRNA ligase family protein [Streptomyces]ARE75616.1 methionine--tRNA ligase [Streptomyces sp. Sge12]KOG58109.1 methionine--tRNA ligase [Streptomyces virginiae]